MSRNVTKGTKVYGDGPTQIGANGCGHRAVYVRGMSAGNYGSYYNDNWLMNTVSETSAAPH